jgi:hypothetical protein
MMTELLTGLAPTRERDLPIELDSSVAAARDRAERAIRVREQIIEMCAGDTGGHLGGSMSLVEILLVLYFDVLRLNPDAPADPARDLLLLSKGHGVLCLYAVLAQRGFLPASSLPARRSFHGTPESGAARDRNALRRTRARPADRRRSGVGRPAVGQRPAGSGGAR